MGRRDGHRDQGAGRAAVARRHPDPARRGVRRRRVPAAASGGSVRTGPPAQRRRYGHPGAIVEAAIAIADAEGLAAVSLRRIAVELSVATMTLYRSIAGKDDLLAGMMDTLSARRRGRPPGPLAGGRSWKYLARRQWRTYQSHPWLAQVVSLTRPQWRPMRCATPNGSCAPSTATA
jgi:hypothetical protein